MAPARENTNTHSSTAPYPRTDSAPYVMLIGGAQIGELYKLARARTVVGRSPDSDLRLEEPGLSREHAELLVESGRLIVRDLGSKNGTYVNGNRVETHELRDGDQVVLGAATLLVFTHRDGIERAYSSGRSHAAVRGAATVALRSEVFMECLAQEISFSRRHAAPLALMLLEVDGYADLANRHGPAGARELMADVAHTAAEALREEDVLAEFGPGRFAVACRETSADEARARGERVRVAITEASYQLGGADTPRLSLSVGIAPCPAGQERLAANALVQTTERALAHARALGGNRVVVVGG